MVVAPSVPDRRFARTLAVTVGVLLVLCVGFLALGYLQGPRLTGASVDTAGVIDQPGQQLRLFTNQAVTDVTADQVTVTPSTAFTVSTAGDIIIVQFADRLLYDTDYTVRVDSVTSVYASRESELSYGFTTDSPQIFYLDRGEPTDEIVRTTTAGTTRESVYQAVGIQDFVAFGKSAVVATIEGSSSALSLVSLTDGGVQPLALPSPGLVGRLQAAASGTVVGFTLTDDARQPGVPLYTVDLELGADPRPVVGFDGEPLRVSDWRFLPDAASLVALSGTGDLLFVDLATGAAVPLGQFQSLVGVAPDGSSAVVTDALGAISLTIADGSQERIEVADSPDGPAYLGPMSVLPDGTIIAKAVLASTFSPVVLRVDGASTVVLYRTVRDAGSIQDVTVSPNGQYVAIETVPDLALSSSDNYSADARDPSTTTVIVDVASGTMVSSFTGFALDW